MDVTRFTSESPGELVSIGPGEAAFLPHPLPPAWQFPASLWPLLSDAKRYLGELEGIGSVLPNPGILLRPLADREAIQSSRLEGTYATPRELLLFELQPKEPASESDKFKDHQEVYNYQRALHHGSSSTIPLSLRLIRELHEILLSGVRGRDKTPGEFRRVQVAIGATRRFIPPPPERLEECLFPLETYFHHVPVEFDPLVYCFLVHYQFETIHPFVDGNGRVGRLLLAMMLQQRCGLSKPWLYMSEFFERHRDEYVDALFAVSTSGSWARWVELCLQGTLSQAKNTIVRCRQLLRVREDYVQRVANVGGSLRLSRIVEDVFSSPFVRVATLAKNLNVTYPTAKADIDRLVQAGVLMELPDVSPKTFYAPAVFNVAYGGMGDSVAEDSGTP